MTSYSTSIRNFASMLKRVIILCFIVASAFSSEASHIIGSDFTYQCLGNDTYRFTLSIYRDCRPANQGGGNPAAIVADNPAYITIFDGAGNRLDFDSIFSFSSVVIPPEFSNECITNIPNKCLNRIRFTFNRVLPGNSTGYFLVYQRCCRNESTLNITNPGGTGASFICFVPPSSAAVCNSSPVFKNDPPQIICINNPLVYDNSATDADGDSLSYEFCSAIRGGDTQTPKPIVNNPPPYAPVFYASPFSAILPMAGNPQININPVTGIITGTPNIQGIFVVTVCCNEWRNGNLINSTRRDFQVEVTNCSKAVVANIPVLSQEPNTHIIQCKGFDVNFINTSSGGFSYHWDFGVPGVNNDTSNLFQPSFTYPDTGTYTVKLVLNRGTTCPDSIERLVKIYPTFNGDYSFSGLLCPNQPIDFTDLSTSTQFPINYWDWNFDDGTKDVVQNPTHFFPNIGKNFQVTLISGNSAGCRDTTTKSLLIPKVGLFAGNDTTIIINRNVTFNATGTQTYAWNPPLFLDNPFINNPTGFYTDTGRIQYVVTGVSENGCPASDSIIVYISDKEYIIVPNAFSPNGDGNNDVIKIIGAGFKQLNYFKIYNRWGQKVFETNNFLEGWDGTLKGTPQPISTYFWIINAVDVDNQSKSFRGDLTLIR
jgi:gliding motility-associated-like protein